MPTPGRSGVHPQFFPSAPKSPSIVLQPKLPIVSPDAGPPADALDLAAYAVFIERLNAGEAIDGDAARLVDAAIATSMRPGFEEFVSLAHLRFVPFAHQLAAARRAR